MDSAWERRQVYGPLIEALTPLGADCGLVSHNRDTALAEVEADQAFHIFDRGQVRHERALNFGSAYIAPFYYLDPVGTRSLSSIGVAAFDAAAIEPNAAQAFQAEAVFLRTPGVMKSAALRDAALADVHVQKALRMLDELNIVFVGIGPADFHGPLEENDNFFTAEQLAEVRKAGAVGQLHQRFIDSEGQPVRTPLDDLVIGISLAQLRDAGRRIAVAGGASKHKALAAALAGEWIDVLVTDVESANHLLANASAPRKLTKGKS